MKYLIAVINVPLLIDKFLPGVQQMDYFENMQIHSPAGRHPPSSFYSLETSWSREG